MAAGKLLTQSATIRKRWDLSSDMLDFDPPQQSGSKLICRNEFKVQEVAFHFGLFRSLDSDGPLSNSSFDCI